MKSNNLPVTENPFQTINDLFAYAHLHELEAGLWEWMKLTASGTWHKEKPLVRSDVLYLYEKMVELVRAAHAIKEKQAGKRKSS